MKGQWLLMAMVLLGGSLLPIQAAMNGRLGAVLENRSLAALVSFAVGTIGLTLYVLLSRTSLPSADVARTVPWWAWLGGLCGAIYIPAVIIAAPRLGGAALTGLSVGAQMAASAVLDQWGLLGLPVHPITPGRAMGLVLIVVGVVLLQRK